MARRVLVTPPDPDHRRQPMIDRSVAQGVPGERTEEQDHEERERKRDHLYDVLAALPLDERVALIERMADRMGV